MKEIILYCSVFVGDAYKWAVKQCEMMKFIMQLYFEPQVQCKEPQRCMA